MRGLCVGAGYFSQFHFDAWRRIDGVEIVAVVDQDSATARQAAEQFRIPHHFTAAKDAVEQLQPDFLDIITPPETHLELVQLAIAHQIPVICQKPLAADFATAQSIVQLAESAGVPLMVHDNFRFQPWYREIKRLLEAGQCGTAIHTVNMRSRPGDGWGPDAYLSRQPYFRQMPRLLVHETGVHFIDTFRFLVGEVTEVYAQLKKLNPVIQGEDAGLLILQMQNGATATWDANRFNESTASDPRYTFGELLLETDAGSIRLYADGRLTLQSLGQPEREHEYEHSQAGFGGDCVRATQQHFVDCLRTGTEFETAGREYLKTLQVVEAVYESATMNKPIPMTVSQATATSTRPPASRPRQTRVIDLSHPIDGRTPGATIRPFKSVEADGWNATTLELYSHTGTHMDAPHHFITGAATLDQQDLQACVGPALVCDLTPVEPRQLLTVDDLHPWWNQIGAGTRLLLRTDWSQRYGTPEFRDELPRISVELARWMVSKQVALVGVEPPSVADVNNLEEVTAVHQTLFRGGVVIVESLANLNQLRSQVVELIALPLRIVGGDGCPVRAIAIET